MGLHSSDWCPYNKATWRHGNLQRKTAHDDGGSDWSWVASDPGMLEPLEAGRDKAVFFLGASGGGWPCQHLDFRLHVSKTVREYIPVDLSHPGGGSLFQ